METLALLIHLPSDRTSHMPWRAALISANAPQHSIEDTNSTYFYVCECRIIGLYLHFLGKWVLGCKELQCCRAGWWNHDADIRRRDMRVDGRHRRAAGSR